MNIKKKTRQYFDCHTAIFPVSGFCQAVTIIYKIIKKKTLKILSLKDLITIDCSLNRL